MRTGHEKRPMCQHFLLFLVGQFEATGQISVGDIFPPVVLWSAAVTQQPYCSIIRKMPEANCWLWFFPTAFPGLFFTIALLPTIFNLGLYSCLENTFCAKSLTATSPNARPKCRRLLSASFDFMSFYPSRTVLSNMLRIIFFFGEGDCLQM